LTRSRTTAFLLLVATLITGAAAGEAHASTPGAWEPDVAAARAYAQQRPGHVTFAVRTEGRFWGHDTQRTVPSASTLKVMLAAAYCRRPSVRRRALNAGDRALLMPMIRASDNVTATKIFQRVGPAGLREVARAAGMERFTPASPIWGNSRVTARDLSKLMLRLDDVLPARHRSTILSFLRTITPSQRWGVGEVAPRGWRLYFKGGWGSGTGAVDHQAALLTKGSLKVSLAITTTGNGTHAAGKETLRGVAARLLRGLDDVDR